MATNETRRTAELVATEVDAALTQLERAEAHLTDLLAGIEEVACDKGEELIALPVEPEARLAWVRAELRRLVAVPADVLAGDMLPDPNPPLRTPGCEPVHEGAE